MAQKTSLARMVLVLTMVGIISGIVLGLCTGDGAENATVGTLSTETVRPGAVRTGTTAGGTTPPPGQPGDVEITDETHPLGRKADEPLPWEGNPELAALRKQYGAAFTMGAFQTTLPDPLFGEEENIAQAARHLAGAVIESGAIFSLDRQLGPRTRARGYTIGPMYQGNQILPTVGGGICKIASTLYNVIVLADLPVVERHPHTMLVPYVPPGQDATISRGTKDLKFRNPHPLPLVIWSQSINRTLFIAVYGPVPAPPVRWSHQIFSRVPPPSVRVRNGSLPNGSTRTVQEGYDSMGVRSWVLVSYPDGRNIRKNMSVDYYQAMPRIIEINP